MNDRPGTGLDFRSLFEAVPTPFLVLLPDHEFTIAAVSDAYLRATLTTRTGILGRGLFEVFPDNPGDPDATGVRNLRASLGRVLAAGVPERMAVQRYDIPRPGGDFEERHWRPLNTPVLVPGGGISHVIHSVEDVTESVLLRRRGVERQSVEAALRETGRWFSTTLNSIGDAVIATDVAGRVTFMNGVAEGLTGWGGAEARGRPLEEVFVIVDESTGDAATNPVEKVLKPGRVHGLANHTVLIGRQGGGRPIDDSAAPVTDDDGRVMGVVLVFHDATRQRQAEDALRTAAVEATRASESDAKFRVMFDRGALFSGILAPDGTVVEANRFCLEACGFTREEIVGKPFWECGWWGRSPELTGMVRGASLGASAGRSFRRETSYFTADGTRRQVDLTLAPVTDDASRVLFVAAYGLDVTERKLSEAVLRESQARLAGALSVANLGTFEWDMLTADVALDDRSREIFGFTPGEGLSAGAVFARIAPADLDRVYAETEASRHVLSRLKTEYRINLPDGTVRTVVSIGNAVAGADGVVEGMVGVFDDVTELRDAEEALRDAQSRLESALDAGAIYTWQWDLLGDHVYADRNLARLFSVSPEVAAGGSINEYTRSIHPEDIDRVMGAIEGAMNSGDAYEVDCRVVKPDGRSRHVTARGKIIRDASGRAIQIPGVIVDVTERTELAARSESQSRLFDTALSNTPDFIYTFDLAGRVTYANHTLLSLWQRRLDEVVGRNFFDLDYPHELAEHLHRQIRQVIDTKGRVSDETPYTSALGRRYYEYIFVPVLSPDGAVEAIVGSTRDVTDRKRVEEAARRRAAQLERLAEVATRINAAHDVNSVLGVVTEEARMLIAARQAAISMVVNPLHPQPINVVSTRAGRTPEPVAAPPEGPGPSKLVNAEVRPIRLSQGDLKTDPRWGELAGLALAVPTESGWLAAPLVGRDGKSMGLLQLADKEGGEFTTDDEAILVQLSRLAAIAVENARLYEELRGNDRRKDEFLAMLAHELRNPLSAIGNAVKLTSRTGLQEHIDWSMEVITRQMQHLTRLIDDLLDVSRINRGKIELRRDVVDVTPILDSAAATVETLVGERKHTLEVAIDRGDLWVDVDPTRIEQVVVNLLNNAAKYSENAGRIRLSARKAGREVVIAVKDEGVGIPPEKLPQMFELFAQGDRSLARSEGGLGIGLTLVKKLVEMHGGTVTARSEGPGRGSEFTIRLPAAARPAAAGAAPKAATAGGPGRKARILVVDDNVDTARGMARLLKLLGHEVVTAHDGPEAIRAARDHRPEFVMLDIGLPGMSGYEVANALRREEWCQGTLIIAVSGYGQDEDRRRSREAGFDHHLIKPLDHDALLTLLTDAGGGLG